MQTCVCLLTGSVGREQVHQKCLEKLISQEREWGAGYLGDPCSSAASGSPLLEHCQERARVRKWIKVLQRKQVLHPFSRRNSRDQKDEEGGLMEKENEGKYYRGGKSVQNLGTE